MLYSLVRTNLNKNKYHHGIGGDVMSDKKSQEVLSNELVRYSRAGDAFHYRFAARFCLDMINPKSEITEITIEGSKEPRNPSKSGEYVIDLGIYKDLVNQIEFYQLKHTSVQHDKFMNMSELKDTIVGFSNRFTVLKKEKSTKLVKFIIVTNRTLNPLFLENINKIANGDLSSKRYVNKLIEYTKFSKRRLIDFCKVFFIYDSLGDYREQYNELKIGTQNLIAGTNGTDVVNSLIALIESRVLPDCDKPITKEDVLKRFGCNFISDLFPAPPEFEKNDDVLWRSEFVRIADMIQSAKKPLVITAAGGVGKSIFTNNLEKHVSKDMLIIRYDCFGNGIYRNRRNFRHRYRDFIVQIVNELSEKGLCDPLFYTNADDTKLLVVLHSRLNEAIKRHNLIYKNGRILIIIDAADNACMAAENNNDITFANEILRETFSEKINVALLCRPERQEMLDIPHSVGVIEMKTFSVEDTRDFIKLHFENVSMENIEEFHRLTSGNPRIQSIAIQIADDFREVLIGLGPFETTVEEQIKLQVESAVNSLLDELTGKFKDQILMICYGLALLPPDIPVKDLSNVIGIDETYIISFVSVLGGQIWIADGLMHFRDEPTEDWFINNFKPSNEIVERMIANIENYAKSSYYLAYSLPELYLLVGRYDDLIEMVNEGKYLPEDTELDIWDLEINRFRFALKAALKRKKYHDITEISLIIGQKASEQTRLVEFYDKNVDILNVFYGDEFLSDLAFKKILSSGWNGSSVMFSALILSFAKQYVVDARSYLRSSKKWLQIFFEEREKKDQLFRDQLSNRDIYLFALTYYNLFGIESCVNYIKTWSPDSVHVAVSGMLTRYLLDICDYSVLEQFIEHAKDNIHCLVGINGELENVGRSIVFDDHKELIEGLDIISFDYPLYDYFHDEVEHGYIISFCELLAVNDRRDLCLQLLDKYMPLKVERSIFSDYLGKSRSYYLRAFVIRKFFDSSININNNPYFTVEGLSYSEKQKLENHKGICKVLIPWYELLFSVKCGEEKNLYELTSQCYKDTRLSYHSQYGQFNSVEYEQYDIACKIFINYKWHNIKDAKKFYNSFVVIHEYCRIKDKIEMLRAITRKPHCIELVDIIEKDAVQTINISCDEPYDRIEMFILLSRALLAISNSDARVYFKYVVDEITKYGEELPIKWRVIENLGRTISENVNDDNELSYRLIRVAEFIGEHIAHQKYWSRNGAVKIVTYLSPCQGAASVSRWRERDIGRHRDLFISFIEALIDKKVLEPEQLWGLTGFLEESESTIIEIACYCIDNIVEIGKRDFFIEELIKLISFNGFDKWNVQKLKSFLGSKEISVPELYSGRNSIVSKETYIGENTDEVNRIIKNFFEEWKFNNIDSIIEVQAFKDQSKGVYFSNKNIWIYFFNNIRLDQYELFLESISSTNALEIYFIIELICRIPSNWKKRIGFQSKWIETLECIGKNYCSDLFRFCYRSDIERNSHFTRLEYEALYTGIFDGLNYSNQRWYFDDYYDFAVIASRLLPHNEVKKFLELMLGQFETEMDVDFSDGPYTDELNVNKDIDVMFSTYLKVALGSPENDIRWQATHSIIRYSKLVNKNVFKDFVGKLYRSEIAGFINGDFVFYEMDFEIHFLIAVHRILVDEPDKVLLIMPVLKEILEKRQNHDVIVYKIYQILKTLDNNNLIEFTFDVLTQLEERFQPIGVISSEKYYSRERTDKYKAYENSEYNTWLPYSFEDWLKRLERIFKVPEKHLRNMLKEIIYHNFDVNNESENENILRDGRKNVFKGHRFQHKTFASHGEHPSVENLNFYYSYHAFFMLAHKLYSENEIFMDEYEKENPYIDLLESELLTRNDGYLLYDSKTTVPVERVNFEMLPIDDKWLEDVSMDYLNELFSIGKEICVSGSWNTRYSAFNEKIEIYSALVEDEYLESLLMTLRSMKPNDYYVGESDYHDEKTPFVMNSWIGWESDSRGIEANDPWTLEMSYPGHFIKDHYLKMLELKRNEESNKWMNSIGHTVIRKEVWTEEYERNNESEYHYCERILCNNEILNKLCTASGKILLLNVKVIRRQVSDIYSGYQSGDYHRFHHFKVFRGGVDCD